MITEIPTPDDFLATGLQLLNSAWDTGAALMVDLSEAEQYNPDAQELKDDYWQAARVQLSSALAAAQQGNEFLLKSRIATVTPLLLLGAAPKDWPAGCATKPTPFAEFRTLDAQDLIKVHNTCCSPALSDEFITLFEQLRRKRNTIMHSVDKNLSVHVSELFLAVLTINETLGTEKNWASVRHEYLSNAPLSLMHSSDWGDMRLVQELVQ